LCRDGGGRRRPVRLLHWPQDRAGAVNKEDSRLYQKRYVTESHEFFETRPQDDYLARFVPILRTFTWYRAQFTHDVNHEAPGKFGRVVGPELCNVNW